VRGDAGDEVAHEDVAEDIGVIGDELGGHRHEGDHLSIGRDGGEK
jgi:hypothetical protein